MGRPEEPHRGHVRDGRESVYSAGGDVIPSFGGWSGTKLGSKCTSASALAGAYQKVIDAYGLKAIDLDIENTDEFQNAGVQDRILNAVKIAKSKNPGLRVVITIGTETSGPETWGKRLINQAKAVGAGVDVWSVMPFDFSSGGDMAAHTKSAVDGLKNQLKSTFGWNDDTAYRHSGLSSMTATAAGAASAAASRRTSTRSPRSSPGTPADTLKARSGAVEGLLTGPNAGKEAFAGPAPRQLGHELRRRKPREATPDRNSSPSCTRPARVSGGSSRSTGSSGSSRRTGSRASGWA